MMNKDEFGVIRSPRPGPISSASDLLIPALAVLGARLLSTNCPWASEAWTMNIARPKKTARYLLFMRAYLQVVVQELISSLQDLIRARACRQIADNPGGRGWNCQYRNLSISYSAGNSPGREEAHK